MMECPSSTAIESFCSYKWNSLEVEEGNVEDTELLERWRAGDKEASQVLLRRHFPMLYRFFANKVDSDVDDLVQQTMLALLASRERIENKALFRSYLLGIARFQLYEHLRRKKRADMLFEWDTLSVFDVSPSPSTMAQEKAEQRLVLEALRRIPLNFQIALELHYWEDFSGPELAEVLGVPVDTAYSRLKKARELVKKQLRVLSGAGGRDHRDDANDRDASAENALFRGIARTGRP